MHVIVYPFDRESLIPISIGQETMEKTKGDKNERTDILEFLENRIYLPGYMGIRSCDYSGRSGVFDFTPTEPPVTKVHLDYLTPRGIHIFLSQAGICLTEQLLQEEGFDIGIEEYRILTMDGRMKIVELNQKYRKELKVDGNLQGKLNLTRIRQGKIPVVKLDFDIGNRAVTGNLVCVLASNSVPQANYDILRN